MRGGSGQGLAKAEELRPRGRLLSEPFGSASGTGHGLAKGLIRTDVVLRASHAFPFPLHDSPLR